MSPGNALRKILPVVDDAVVVQRFSKTVSKRQLVTNKLQCGNGLLCPTTKVGALSDTAVHPSVYPFVRLPD